MSPTRTRASLLCLVFLVLAGCAKGTATVADDMRKVVVTVCPGNPLQCDGTCCGDRCVDTSLDVKNCGACGVQCSANTVCSKGACGCLPTGNACATGQTCCGTGGCKGLDSDVNNCGGCGNVCGPGATCTSSQCTCGGAICASGQTCCNGVCAATCTSAPDMSTTGACQCASGCPLSGACVGTNCCFEDVLFGTCMPDATCLQSGP